MHLHMLKHSIVHKSERVVRVYEDDVTLQMFRLKTLFQHISYFGKHYENFVPSTYKSEFPNAVADLLFGLDKTKKQQNTDKNVY